jgi:hypothetical protein
MKLILIVGLLALAGCAGNKPAVEQAKITTTLSEDEAWCERLYKTDAGFQDMLAGSVNTWWEMVDVNTHEPIGRCDCISITKCGDIDYCRVSKCPTETSYYLDSTQQHPYGQ